MTFFWQIGLLMLMLEFAAFAFVIQAIGAFNTAALLGLSCFIGLWLMRREGAQAALNLVSGARINPAQLLETGSILLAGLLLFIPGFVSDIAALAVLAFILGRTMIKRPQSSNRPAPGDEDIIEGRYEIVEEPPAAPQALDERR